MAPCFLRRSRRRTLRSIRRWRFEAGVAAPAGEAKGYFRQGSSRPIDVGNDFGQHVNRVPRHLPRFRRRRALIGSSEQPTAPTSPGRDDVYDAHPRDIFAQSPASRAGTLAARSGPSVSTRRRPFPNSRVPGIAGSSLLDVDGSAIARDLLCRGDVVHPALFHQPPELNARSEAQTSRRCIQARRRLYATHHRSQEP